MLMPLFAGSQPVEKHLFDRFIVRHQDVAHSVSAHEMADFLGEILHMVTGALKRLGHEDDLQAGLPLHILWILNMAQEDQIPKAIHFRVSAEHFDRFFHIAR